MKQLISEKVLNIVKKWIFLSDGMKIKDIDEELKCNVMEFINAPIGHNNITIESHPQAYHTSRLFDFTSKNLNEILESEDSQAYHASSYTGITEDLDDCIIVDK